MFKIDFHLLTFKNTLTLQNGEIKEYSYKSYGGRIFLLWLIGMYIYSYYNNIDFLLWKNILLGTGFAIIYDIITVILYFLKIKIAMKIYSK